MCGTKENVLIDEESPIQPKNRSRFSLEGADFTS